MTAHARWFGRPRPAHDEAGSAMIIAIMVVAVIGVLGTSLAVQASYGTRSSGGSAVASTVKDLGDAGLAQGVTMLRDLGPDGVNSAPAVTDPAQACLVPTPAAGSPAWTRASAARIGSGAGQAVVWVEPVVKAISGSVGSYRICSRATSGTGVRTVSVNAVYTPEETKSPFVVYANGSLTLEGDAGIADMSAYSETCIERKGNKIQVVGTDKASGLPAAAHARLWVLDSTGSNQSCQSSGSVHAGNDFVDSNFPYDTDQAGGSVAGDVHAVGKPALLAVPWSGSTLEPAVQSAAEFKAKWGLPDMLGSSSMANLERIAREQRNYYGDNPNESDVIAPDEDHAVIFLDYTVRKLVELKDESFTDKWERNTNPVTCPDRSLVLVVRGADVKLNGNGSLAATLIIKNGDLLKSSGSNIIIGGVFAENVDLTGTADLVLDDCAVANFPPLGTARVDVVDYLEHDRT